MPLRLPLLVFILLFVIELPLVAVAVGKRQRAARFARSALFLVPLAAAIGLRAYQALAMPGVLDWDETYYVSQAITGAHGHGLYPYVFGYPPMLILGGTGYAAYLYVLAVKIAGPTILALRAVSLLASVAALVFMWLLVRTLYGSGTAWVAAALNAALRLFVMSNSVRMDSFAFAYVAGGLLAAALAFTRWSDRRRHFVAGLVFGLGLQVHIDTVITALACGAAYAVFWARDAMVGQRLAWPREMLLYIAGFCAGLIVFVCCNVLPDPAAFYRTTVLVRVDAVGWYASQTPGIFGSFLNPRVLLLKEQALYTALYRAVPAVEIALATAGVCALLVRRSSTDWMVLTVVAGVLVAAAIVLNNASPLYFIHVTPALVVPVAALLTHGVRRRAAISTGELGAPSLLAFAVIVCALVAVNSARAARSVWTRPAPGPATMALVDRVRAAADRNCKVAGDATLYVEYFADYPYFVSVRPTEVKYAMLYFGTASEADYWEIKQPDVVFATGPLSAGLSTFVSRQQLLNVDRGIWIRRGGCRGGP